MHSPNKPVGRSVLLSNVDDNHRQQQTAPSPKLLLSNVVSLAASRSRLETHRSHDASQCETCHSRLQKLDEFDRKQTELEMMLQIYQKKVDISKRLLDEYREQEKPFLDNLGQIFNRDQILRILTGHCLKRRGGATWDDATLRKAAKLYFLCSPQGYNEVLALKLPLPSSHTLQSVIQKGRPQPMNVKSIAFDPFSTDLDIRPAITGGRKFLASQNRPKIQPLQQKGYKQKISEIEKANEETIASTSTRTVFRIQRQIPEEEECPSDIDMASPPPATGHSVERDVGIVVRHLVDEVVKVSRTRAPYISILRSSNEPPAKRINLLMPRHLLKAGQKIILKRPMNSTKPPTVQVISDETKRSVVIPTAQTLE